MRGSGNTEIVIDADIPTLAVSTVELRYTRATQLTHDHLYHVLADSLYRGSTNTGASTQNNAAAMDWASYRQLSNGVEMIPLLLPMESMEWYGLNFSEAKCW